MAKGIDLEVKLKAFLRSLFEDLGFPVLEARQQQAGTQNGFDIRITFLDASEKKREFYFECKDYTSPLPWNEMLRKIHELNASGHPADGFVGISPRRNLSNVNANVQHTLPKLVKFPVRFWTPDAQVKEYLSLDKTLFQEIYAEVPPAVEAEKVKQTLRLFIRDMLRERDELLRGNTFPKDLTLKIPKIHTDDIIGRADELQSLHQALFQNKQVVLVNGLGGIGKTTLAQGYLSSYYPNYQHVAWITQTSPDITQDIAQDEGLLRSLSISRDGKDVQQLLLEILHKFKTISDKPNLLVLDNADRTLANLKDMLPGQPDWHLLVTSRERIEGFQVQEIGFLSASAALTLFKKHCSRMTDDASIRELLEVVDYHTLTLEILAKTAQLQRVDIHTLKTAIEQDLRANVYVAHKGDKVDRVRSYLSSIFTLSKLTEDEMWLIKYFACLPAEYHVYTTLYELMEVERSERAAVFSEVLTSLADQGWLLYNAETDSYKMHRIITEVAVKRLPILFEDVKSLVYTVGQKLSRESDEENPVVAFPWVPFGRILVDTFPTEVHALLALLQNNLAMVFVESGDYTAAKALLEQAIAIYEAEGEGFNYVKAHSYGNLGQVYWAMGDLASARHWQEKGILLEEQNSAPDYVLEQKYANLAVVLQGLGNHAEARRLLERCVRITEKHFGKDDTVTAFRYASLGNLLQAMGDYEGAYTQLKEALRICEKQLDAGHPTLMTLSISFATVLLELGDYAAAKPLLEGAVKYTEETFGPEHPKMASPLSKLAMALYYTGNSREGRPLLKRAIEINERYRGTASEAEATFFTDEGSSEKNGDMLALLKEALQISESAGQNRAEAITSLSALAPAFFASDDSPLSDPERAVSLPIQADNAPWDSDGVAPSWLQEDGEDEQDPDLLLKNVTQAELEKVIALMEEELGAGEEELLKQLHTLAVKFYQAENYERAKEVRERMIAICEQRFGIEDVRTMNSYAELAGVLDRQENYHEAKDLLEKVIVFFEREYGPEDLRTISHYGPLADVLYELDEYERAKTLQQSVVKVFAQNFGEGDPDLAELYEDLARTLRVLDEDEEAAEVLRKAVSLREKHGAKNDPELAESYRNLASALYTLGDYTKAKTIAKKAISSWEKVLSKDHPDIIECYRLLADVHLKLGEYEPAKTLLQKIIAIQEGSIGENDTETINNYIRLLPVLEELDESEEAKKLLYQTIRVSAEIPGSEIIVAQAYSYLGSLHTSDEEYDQAHMCYEKTLPVYEKTYGPEHASTMSTYEALADVHKKSGRYPEAQRLYEKLVKGYEQRNGSEHPQTMTACLNLAAVLKLAGYDVEADQVSERALTYVNRTVIADQNPESLGLFGKLGVALTSLGQYQAARTLLEETVSHSMQHHGETHKVTVLLYHKLATILSELKDHTEAKRIYEYIVKAEEESYKADHPKLMESYDILASLYAKTGDYPGAKRLLKKVIPFNEEYYGKDDPHTIEGYKRLASVLQALNDHAGVKAMQKKILHAEQRSTKK